MNDERATRSSASRSKTPSQAPAQRGRKSLRKPRSEEAVDTTEAVMVTEGPRDETPVEIIPTVTTTASPSPKEAAPSFTNAPPVDVDVRAEEPRGGRDSRSERQRPRHRETTVAPQPSAAPHATTSPQRSSSADHTPSHPPEVAAGSHPTKAPSAPVKLTHPTPRKAPVTPDRKSVV